MKEILIFAGTTEGRRLSECLSKSEIRHTLCVATEYGENVLTKNPFMTVHRGRMDVERIKEFIQSGDYMAVVDATHPYADEVTNNIKLALHEIQEINEINIPYLRLKREIKSDENGNNVTYFSTNEECVKSLENIKGNILLTTGSKELGIYCENKNIKDRLYVRVLPSTESISLCVEQGLKGKQIIAMQGPFTSKMNEAIISQYDISCLVTKSSGISGGYQEKLEAAQNSGIDVYVIGHSNDDKGYTFDEVCRELENICGKEIINRSEMLITLAGVGMGNEKCLTGEVKERIEEADILLGAKRLIEPFKAKVDKRPYYMADHIIPYLSGQHGMQGMKVVVLFSGDTGFYSGSKALYQALMEEIKSGRLNAKVQIMPGISSVAYMAASIGEDYQNAEDYSMHGKRLSNLSNRIKTSHNTFLLMSGVIDVNYLGQALIDAGLEDCEVTIGYQLSYPGEQIIKKTARECIELKSEGLYTCFIKNHRPIHKILTHGIRDDEFIRDKVPMTKEEVREVSISKLRLYNGAVVYDIGSGTGSIAIEIAGLSNDIWVYAIEKKDEAISLIEKNKKKFGLENITVIKNEAPKGLENLSKATHAFIGGSGGNLKEILKTLYKINPNMRVVINAVSIETISEIKEILDCPNIINVELIQMQINRVKQIGEYHMMQAQNPVWICSFDFLGDQL